MSTNRPILNNIVVMRERINETADQSVYYMLLSDIKDFRRLEDDSVDAMISILEEDKYCIVNDVFGKEHRMYYNDVMEINRVNDELSEGDIFSMILGAWQYHRSGVRK